ELRQMVAGEYLPPEVRAAVAAAARPAPGARGIRRRLAATLVGGDQRRDAEAPVGATRPAVPHGGDFAASAGCPGDPLHGPLWRPAGKRSGSRRRRDRLPG